MHKELTKSNSEKVLQTCLRDLTAHSSKVSAASSLPCRRYRAPRFLRVVFTVGLDTDIKCKIENQNNKFIQITLPHLLTLQALYQPPYSPYGVFSLFLA